VAALTGQKMHIPEISYPETGEPISPQIAIAINEPELCRGTAPASFPASK